jgi:hypothetical protein
MNHVTDPDVVVIGSRPAGLPPAVERARRDVNFSSSTNCPRPQEMVEDLGRSTGSLPPERPCRL